MKKKIVSINESNNVTNILKVTHVSSFAAVEHQMENTTFCFASLEEGRTGSE